MPTSTHYRHETKEGALSVVLNTTAVPRKSSEDSDDEPDYAVEIQLVFESATTGAFYDTIIPYSLLCRICPLFHAVGEVTDVFASAPTITVDNVMAMAHWHANGQSRVYPVDIVIRRREYPESQRDVTELRTENTVLRKKVAALETRIESLEKMCGEFSSNIAILAALNYQSNAMHPRVIPKIMEMSDTMLGRMMTSLCDFNHVIDGSALFNLNYDKIMRIVDRGFDPNLILENDRYGESMPLIFKVVNDHESAGCLIDKRVVLFGTITSFIRYLLSKGYDPNVVYKENTVIRTLGHVSNPVHGKPRHAFHNDCVEYCDYCDTLCKILRDAGAK